MFQMGFEKEIFSGRHPEMGVSFNEIQTWWKSSLPGIKTALKPATTTPLPGTVPLAPVTPRIVSTQPSSGGSTLLWVGALAALGLGGYYLLAKKPFGLRK